MGRYLIELINAIAQLYIILILIRSIMTWLRQDVILQMQAFFLLVAKLVDPLLIFIRKVFPTNINRIDISPIIAILLVVVAKIAVISLLSILFNNAV